MNRQTPYQKIEISSEPIRMSGRGCSHCERRVDLLVSEPTCPERYRCPLCRTRWIFCDAELCAGCQKPVSVFTTFGNFDESEPEGVLIEGSAYCWECAEEVMRTVERTT
jgi:hypothetical protein